MINKIPENANIILDGEDSRQIGFKCRDCGSRWVVYSITAEKPPAWPAGAYCYPCLLKRCVKANQIPVPMPEQIFDLLKEDIARAIGNTQGKRYYWV